MPSLSEAAQMSAAATKPDKEYESLTGASDDRDVLQVQVPTIFTKCIIKSKFMFGLKVYLNINRFK